MQNRLFSVVGLLAMAVLASACSRYYWVDITHPPVVDLKATPTIGVVEFEVSEGYPLAEEVTHRFIATMQRSQPGVRVLQLGTKEAVLAKIGRSDLGPDALSAIASQYKVDAVLWGNMDVSKARPSVSMNESNLLAVNARLNVDANLKAELHEISSGAMVWTNGAHGTWTLGGVNTGSGGGIRVGVSDPAQKYEQMLNDLVNVSTRDFRPTYERKRVPKHQPPPPPQ